MADNHVTPGTASGAAYFKEAVCIDTGRVFDSASDKDCLEDLQVFFSAQSQAVVDQAALIKVRSAEVIDVYLTVEPIPFNKGFFAVDLNFFFQIELNALATPTAVPVPVIGLSCFSKKVILYGSEGNVKVFSSEPRNCCGEDTPSNMPTASISVVDPICLGCRLVSAGDAFDTASILPESITKGYEGDFINVEPQKIVLVTLGMFTIVRLARNVQMLVPVYDYCIPDRDSGSGGGSVPAEDPCELFKRIKFPTNEFFPNSNANISLPCEEEKDCDCNR